MKVLLLTHPELDHMGYMTYDGLCRNIGDDNVITYPPKQIYYGEIAKDYILDDGKRGFTAPPEYMTRRNKPIEKYEELVGYLYTLQVCLHLVHLKNFVSDSSLERVCKVQK